MTWFWVLDVVCLLWVLAGAVLVVWLRNLSGAVMALSLTGMGMTVLFVVLGAPDVAHAEVVVGSIALPVLYLVAIGKCRTVVERDDESNGEDRELHGREPVHRRWTAAMLSAGVFTGLVVAFTGLPDETAELPAVARRAMTGALPDFRTTEPVSAVVYGYRAMDTFGETFLLLAAVVAVMVLTRTREARHGFVGEEKAADDEQQDVDQPRGGSSSDDARRAERVEEGRAPGRARDPRPGGARRTGTRDRAGDDRRDPDRGARRPAAAAGRGPLPGQPGLLARRWVPGRCGAPRRGAARAHGLRLRPGACCRAPRASSRSWR